ncbi:MAG: hypothetical protein GY811_23110 [Myxococcales bacterium]|nr:hypothetical protein [Myxococcales bacterium]
MLFLLTIAGGALAEARADACGQIILNSTNSSSADAQAPSPAEVQRPDYRAPQIIDSGFFAGGRARTSSDFEPMHLWMQFENTPPEAKFVILESVWGQGPDALSGMWERKIPMHDGFIAALPQYLGPHREQPFTLGVRAIFVMQDGSLSAPSLPVFISHAGAAKHRDGLSADSVLMALCSLGLLGLCIAYRREVNPVHRVRIATGTALLSLFFLSIAPALSWFTVEGPSGRAVPIDCHLGDEAQCATYAPDAGPNPTSTSDIAAERRFEVSSWMGASSALRVGLVWCLVLLLPGLIWLMVVPTLRSAQTVVAFGASAAGYTFLAAIFYRLCTPSWMSAQSSYAFDLTLLTSGAILLSIILIIRWTLQLEIAERPELPPAVARRV